MPIWLLPEDDPDGFTDDDESFAEKEQLCSTFLEEVARSRNHDGGEWIEAYEKGRAFRKFVYRLDTEAIGWRQKSFGLWVEDKFEWAKDNPGVGCPHPDELFINAV